MHVRIHTKEQPFKCKYCSKSYKQSAGLRYHIRTHTGEKPYQCQYCQKKFTGNTSLRAHVRTHTGDKPYKCPYCSKAFTMSDPLRCHMRTHTREKPCKCLYCSKESHCFLYHGRTDDGENSNHNDSQCCSKKFTTHVGVKCHTATINTCEKPFQYQQCLSTAKNHLKKILH